MFRTPLLFTVALALAVAALFVALPLALVNAVVHRGLRRALFVQPRVGQHGRTFDLYKFRTMRGDEDSVADDLRVTRLGRLMRNTHLDELPQLLNVLAGDMCLIGPRPEMVSIDRWARANVPGWHERHALRPGLTGHAQITQGYTRAGDADAYARKLELDRAYIARITVLGDVSICLRTAHWMLRGRGWWRKSARPACR